MTATTHYAFSFLLCSAAGAEPKISMVASIVSLLPDIDHPSSFIGRLFPFASESILKKWGHRTVTHSIFAVLVIALLLSPVLIFHKPLYCCLILAYFSHIFIDLFNKSGVKLFAPLSDKEYISFRTKDLRILVSSWQEYVLLFVIIFFAFSISGESFPIGKAVHALSRNMFKTYDHAITDFQSSGNFMSKAEVKYFNPISRTMVEESLDLLHIDSKKAIFIKDKSRFVLNKNDIESIKVIRSEKKMAVSKITGDVLGSLLNQPGYLCGKIIIKNFKPEIENTHFITAENLNNKTIITLQYALAGDLIMHDIEGQRNRAIEQLQLKSNSHQIIKLREQKTELEKKLSHLQRKGIYRHYSSITNLSNRIEKLQNKIINLESLGGGLEVESELIRLSDVSYNYEIISYL